MNDYREFLESKMIAHQPVGFDVPESELNPLLFPFQRDCVRWALRQGRGALFQERGLGKTFQELEWSRHVAAHTGGKVLIVAPLAVAKQTVREGDRWGIPCRYVRSQEDADAAPESIIVCNYDMLKAFDAAKFKGVVLDESSILKAFTGKTKQYILSAFKDTPFKLCGTATPAPNDHLELGNHAEFLGVMPSNEMISRWFINDTMEAGNYRLKKHAAKDFWRWVASWAVCISLPSDIGHEDDGYILPELKIQEHVVAVDHTRAFAQGQLFLMSAQSATEMWREKRATAEDRADEVARIINGSQESWVVWVDMDVEADAVCARIPSATEVRGGDSPERKEQVFIDFVDGKTRVLVTKLDIAGFGMNFQHCHNMVFAGLTYSFEKTYQGLGRCWRFGQKHPVNVHMVYAESEESIVKTLRVKQGEHDQMQAEMRAAMAFVGVKLDQRRRELIMAESFDKQGGNNWTMYHGDCVQAISAMEDQSVDFTIFSPPFSSLYIYSDSVADMGNSEDDKAFFRHFEYLIPELWRVTLAGRLCAVHCKDLPMYMNRDGAAGLRDFPGEIIRAFEKFGWTFHSRVTIWKDPVIEMQRTKNHGLLYKNFRERGEVTRQGMADYIIVFRKWVRDEMESSTSAKPVLHAREDWPLDVWQRYASPVWFDIDQTDVLNYKMAKDNSDEKHICPLQLGVVRRCIEIWTNPGDVVFSPFAGIGSEGYGALELGRKFVGIELKESYFYYACKFLAGAESQFAGGTMFDAIAE